jgi:gluconate 2-dehydrogenase gamma chain
MSTLSRRDFLAIAGTGVASVWLTASVQDLIAAGRHAQAAQTFEYLTPADAAELEAFAAQIVPTDETPGAREARVVHFMDKALATFAKDGRDSFAKGIKELRARAAKAQPGAKSFAELPSEKQIAIMKSMEKDKHPFFADGRQATLAGMLAFPEHGGNYNKIGWKWIGFEDRFSWSAPFGWYDRNA